MPTGVMRSCPPPPVRGGRARTCCLLECSYWLLGCIKDREIFLTFILLLKTPPDNTQESMMTNTLPQTFPDVLKEYAADRLRRLVPVPDTVKMVTLMSDSLVAVASVFDMYEQHVPTTSQEQPQPPTTLSSSAAEDICWRQLSTSSVSSSSSVTQDTGEYTTDTSATDMSATDMSTTTTVAPAVRDRWWW